MLVVLIQTQQSKSVCVEWFHEFETEGKTRSIKSANSHLLVCHSRVLERGSLGPSTVTLMALLYVAICGGEELTMMVRVKLFPETKRKPIFRETPTALQHLFTICLTNVDVRLLLQSNRNRNFR
jgi:hypothetical protein